jgi:hypothetical protein
MHMKAFLAALLVMTTIAVASSFLLNGSFQKNVDQAYATTGARVERTH